MRTEFGDNYAVDTVDFLRTLSAERSDVLPGGQYASIFSRPIKCDHDGGEIGAIITENNKYFQIWATVYA